MFFEINVLKNSANLAGKHVCRCLFLKKLQAFSQACNFIKKRLQHRYFPVKFVKLLRSFFTEHLLVAASGRFIYYTLSRSRITQIWQRFCMLAISPSKYTYNNLFYWPHNFIISFSMKYGGHYASASTH